jgi:hypothetical protein
MNCNFLDNYWKQKTIRADKHFDALDVELISKINCPGIPRDKIKTFYKGTKAWDIHFPSKKVAIEYKTIATEQKGKTVQNQLHINLKKHMGSRVEEAIGCAIDLKHFDEEYKLGYILVFTLPRDKNLIMPKTLIDKTILKFEKMVSKNLYNFFCPLITFGIGDHMELSEEYSFERFINDINSVPPINKNTLDGFFI